MYGYEPILIVGGRREERTMESDPVCGMEVDERSAAARMECKGNVHYFCAQSCEEVFEKSPETYIDGDREAKGPDQVAQSVQAEAVQLGETDMTRLDLPISGMSCASCVARIEKGFSQLRGVVEARVNFAAEKAAMGLSSETVVTNTLRPRHFRPPEVAAA